MNPSTPDIRPARLRPEDYAARFADAGNAFTPFQAVMEAERCLYCFDAPCARACPTGIDVPSFIHRIAQGNLRGAAKAILQANPLGGMCARVCPTEELCEAVCVRQTQQGVPVAIGRLQRHAVDAVMHRPQSALFTRAAPTGRRVAVVGAGPAGLACAHALALQGHAVVLHDARPKGGGLNEYGLAAYKTANDFAQRELHWLLGVGGIELRTGWRLGSAAELDALRDGYDAVFLGLGLGAVKALALPGDTLAGVRAAVDFIAELRQAADLSTLPVGRRVVVIGGGMTAVDAAVQTRLLGAEEVHMVYRRGPQHMGASPAEQAWAQTHGVTLHHWLAPSALEGVDGHVTAVRFERQTEDATGRVRGTGVFDTLGADMVLTAIGQCLDTEPWQGAALAIEGGRIVVDAQQRTRLAGVWAGGDCCGGGRDLTVQAVQDGQCAAQSIHAALMAAPTGA